jgi:hypothetical protein
MKMCEKGEDSGKNSYLGIRMVAEEMNMAKETVRQLFKKINK